MHAALFPDLVVNGESVPSAVVAAEVQNHDGPKGKPGIAWRKAARAIALRTLLLQEARARGIAAEPREVAPGRFETGEEALIRGLLDLAVQVEAPTEAEIRAEWDRDPSRFRSPPLWDVSHILVACDPRDAPGSEAARRRAEMLTARALAAPRSFAALAAEASDCGSKSSGGALGQLGPGDTVPEFEAALRGLTEGAITPEPLQTRHGWHVIQLDAFAGGAVLPYDSVRPKIADAIEKRRWTLAARDFVDALVGAAEIEGAEMTAIAPREAQQDKTDA